MITLLLVFLLAVAAAADLPQSNVGKRLTTRYDDYLSDPSAYRTQVEKEAYLFPEGRLYPYMFPTLAYTNLAARDPLEREHAREQVGKLVDLALGTTRHMVGVPLDEVDDYRGHGTWLGSSLLMLGCWRYLGGDDRYEEIHRALADSLGTALKAEKYGALDSYPGSAWPVDTMVVALGLALRDHQTGIPKHRTMMTKHFDWVDQHATDPRTKLPVFLVDAEHGFHRDLPRGCDLSLRIAFLAQVAPDRAQSMYDEYAARFWISRSILGSGFAEWEGGMDGTGDIDSGIVFKGLGMAATGMGLATTRAVGDMNRWAILHVELQGFRTMMPALLPIAKNDLVFNKLPISNEYATGFLFGDAVLFWAVTWEDWGLEKLD
ncbi:MAG: hypothetical protein HN348_00900 [Proteobacteria bacterium]|jgi:hypothetical protein|nr:hypothetical protein [Pseudomonadota bacterium]